MIRKTLHGAFAEVLGDCVYGGIWVGKDSSIPNINGIRKDFIEGCREAGVTAIRWPGGVFADHYFWKYGIGPNRKNRMYSAIADPESDKVSKVGTKSNEFGTDEFIEMCRLIGCQPMIVANTATGSPEDLLDWFEYCNGDATTYWGSVRAQNGHAEAYNVFTWGLGNTDDNAWHIAYRDPLNYAHDYLRYWTAIRAFKGIRIIGLGYSLRHNQEDWVATYLDYVTKGQTVAGPASLSVHRYTGGAKPETRQCGPSVNYSDEEYFYALDTVKLVEKDIQFHRDVIQKHTNPNFKTTICFDEWGYWHPDTSAGLRQAQTMRDAIFAGLCLHTFYRNCDIVEYAMETQVTNVLQSLFESEKDKFFKTPTFYVFKLYKDHLGNLIVPGGVPSDTKLDCVMSMPADKTKVILTVANKDLAAGRNLQLPDWLARNYRLTQARTITSHEVRDQNTWEKPLTIVDRELPLDAKPIQVPRHSVSRLVFTKN